jgi:hypothetical protein
MLRKFRTKLFRLVERNARILTLGLGSLVVTIWTVLRHITNGVNFDIVGQIGLADQWLQGIHGGAVLGQTNYLLKIPFYMLANGLHYLSPMGRLLFFALLFNAATYIFIFVLVERILRLENVQDRHWFYVAMVWFASIAGGVYWLEYANSRNLETAAGVWLVYLTIRYLKMPRRATAILLAATGSIVFFADPLQLYIIGGGIVLYILGRWALRRTRQNGQLALNVGGAILAALIGAKILRALSIRFLPVQYLAVPPTHHNLDVHTIGLALQTIVVNTFNIFDAAALKKPIGPNTIREFINFVVLLAIISLILYVLTHRKVLKPSGVLLLCIMAADYGAYAASKQILEPNTSRYLIMVPIMAIIFVAIYAPQVKFQQTEKIKYGWLAATALSCLFLLGGIVKSWPERHAKDHHIYQTLAFLEHYNFPYALGSHELGVTTTYFAERTTTVLPVSCTQNNHLHAINLFYDTAAFNGLKHYVGKVPIIVTDASIASGVDHCDTENVVTILGAPQQQISVPSIGTAYIYDTTTINRAF